MNFLGEIKSISSFLKGFQQPEIFSDLTVQLNNKSAPNGKSYVTLKKTKLIKKLKRSVSSHKIQTNLVEYCSSWCGGT